MNSRPDNNRRSNSNTKLGHTPRKRFGQNFLHDSGIIYSIIKAVNAKEDDNLLEIGPGMGALTAGLLETCPTLNVVELDRNLIPKLEAQFKKYPEFSIHQGDVLKFDFSSIGTIEKPLRIVGNLPYNISTPLIFHLLSFQQLIQDMHFMLQKEVVERLVAPPNEKAYGRLGIMVQYFCDVEYLIDVPPSAFNPPPKVDSAVVRLTPHKSIAHPAQDTKQLESVLRQAFNQRRKTIRNNLKTLLSTEQIESLEINPGARPENLPLSDYINISNLLSNINSHSE